MEEDTSVPPLDGGEGFWKPRTNYTIQATLYRTRFFVIKVSALYYLYIPLKNRLGPSCKNSVRVTYYFKLFATRTEFLREGRSLFFSGIYIYV